MKHYKHPTIDGLTATINGNVHMNGRKMHTFLKLPKGYKGVCITVPMFYTSDGNKCWTKHRTVHQLVYECVTGKVLPYSTRTGGMVLNHIDNDKNNNRFDNLEYIPAAKNTSLGKRKLYVVGIGTNVYVGHYQAIVTMVPAGTFNRMIAARQTERSGMRLLATQEPYGEFQTVQ